MYSVAGRRLTEGEAWSQHIICLGNKAASLSEDDKHVFATYISTEATGNSFSSI